MLNDIGHASPPVSMAFLPSSSSSNGIRGVFDLYNNKGNGQGLGVWHYFYAYTAVLGEEPTQDVLRSRFPSEEVDALQVVQALDSTNVDEQHEGEEDGRGLVGADRTSLGWEEFHSEMMIRLRRKYLLKATTTTSTGHTDSEGRTSSEGWKSNSHSGGSGSGTTTHGSRTESSLAQQRLWELFDALDTQQHCRGCLTLEDIGRAVEERGKLAQQLGLGGEASTGTGSSSGGNENDGDDSVDTLDSYTGRLRLFHALDPMNKGRLSFADYERIAYYARMNRRPEQERNRGWADDNSI